MKLKVLCPIHTEDAIAQGELEDLVGNVAYRDDVVVDKHFMVGGTSDPGRGFAGCSLPVVLFHNTPNNSLYILWGPERTKFHGLFPRVSRHREF